MGTRLGKTAAKAIILGKSSKKQQDNEAFAMVKARAKALALRWKKILKDRERAGDERDFNSVLEGLLAQTAAMISYWVKEFKVGVDFDKELGLTGVPKQMYLQIAWPYALKSIEKEKARVALVG